jgi:hypothetical protein
MIKLKSKYAVIVDDLQCEEAKQAFENIEKEGKSTFIYPHPEDETDWHFPFARNNKRSRKIIDEL